jgi:hypothetical protein
MLFPVASQLWTTGATTVNPLIHIRASTTNNIMSSLTTSLNNIIKNIIPSIMRRHMLRLIQTRDMTTTTIPRQSLRQSQNNPAGTPKGAY